MTKKKRERKDKKKRTVKRGFRQPRAFRHETHVHVTNHSHNHSRAKRISEIEHNIFSLRKPEPAPEPVQQPAPSFSGRIRQRIQLPPLEPAGSDMTERTRTPQIESEFGGDPDLSEMRVTDLRKLAKERKLRRYSGMRKDELVQLLEESLEGNTARV